MLLRIVATAILLAAGAGCGRGDTPPAVEDAAPAQQTPPGAGSDVRGTLAPAVAPPTSLVALEPAGSVEIPVKAEPAVMDQVSLVFYPSFLLAQAGQTVEFRNSEDVLHNIRVTEVADQTPIFNVASPPYGKYEYKFERPGVYNFGCDIHSTMRADILVTATPYTTLTAKDGSFTIKNVTPGPYKLTVYAGAAPTVRAVDVKPGATDLGVIQ